MIDERLLANSFQRIAGHPCLDLANTLDYRFQKSGRFRKSGSEELLRNYADFVRFAFQAQVLSFGEAEHLLDSVSARMGAMVVESCRELREAMAAVLYSGLEQRKAPVDSLKLLEEYFQQARQHQHLLWEGMRADWEGPGMEVGAKLPLWRLALEASRLMTSEKVSLVRECGDPECRWLFLDTSKNHTRRWCDMRLCGNRMKARRFKAQHES
jgi:predicted RNA-binding Zn ribbon-like protein